MSDKRMNETTIIKSNKNDLLIFFFFFTVNKKYTQKRNMKIKLDETFTNVNSGLIST